MALLALGLRVQRVGLRPFLGRLMKSLDVGLQLRSVHAPDAATTDLDSRQIAGPNQRIDLRAADVQKNRHIFQSHEPWFDRASSGSRHAFSITGRTHSHKVSIRLGQIPGLEAICFYLLPAATIRPAV